MANSYKNAIGNIPSVKPCYQPGIRALGNNSKHIKASSTSLLNGSVFLDNCLKGKSIWDYTFGYNGQAYYVEVHPAGTNEVDTVINKFTWLKNWLKADGAPLNAINAKDPFHWIASGKVAIAPGSTYAKRLTNAGLSIPKSILSL